MTRRGLKRAGCPWKQLQTGMRGNLLPFARNWALRQTEGEIVEAVISMMKEVADSRFKVQAQIEEWR